MTRIERPSKHKGELLKALRQLTARAAVQFPEGRSDIDKWEWARVLSLTVFEAAKRWNMPADKIVERAIRIVDRQLEREQAQEILAQDIPDFPTSEEQPESGEGGSPVGSHKPDPAGSTPAPATTQEDQDPNE